MLGSLRASRRSNRRSRGGSASGQGDGGRSIAFPPALLREPDVAKALGISAAHLKRLRLAGYVSASTDGKPILYSREDVERAAAFLLTGKIRGHS